MNKRILTAALAAAMILSMATGALAIGQGAGMGGGIGSGAGMGGIGSGAAPGGGIGTGATPSYPYYDPYGPAPTNPMSGISTGDIFGLDDDGYASVRMTNKQLIPGKTYYVALGSAEPDHRKGAARWTDSISLSTNRSVRLAPTSLNISKRKYHPVYGSTEWGYFLELPIQSISGSQYDSQGYLLTGTVRVGQPYGDISVQTEVAYLEGSYEVTHTNQFFSFSDDYDIELSLPYGDSFLILDSKNVKTEVMLSMNTDFDSRFAAQYPRANMDFLNGNGATFPRSAVLHIDARGYRYLYENVGGVLHDLSDHYDRNEDAFVFKTRTFGKYIISDTRLRADGTADTTESHSHSQSPTGGQSANRPASSPTSALTNLVSQNFSNRFVTVAYGQVYTKLQAPVTLSCKGDFSALGSPKALYIYVYDQSRNSFVQLANTRASLSNNTLTFTTTAQGQMVVTDSPLTAR